jgi:hypothetical protein
LNLRHSFSLIIFLPFVLPPSVDAKSAPRTKHTASRTSWLHTRRGHKTCQSIFPENKQKTK